MEEAQLSSVVTNLFSPTPLPNFQFPLKQPFPVVYVYHSEDGGPDEEIILDEMFPFQTIQDIKTYIYIKKDEDYSYHPSFQTLLIPDTAEPSARQEATYTAADFAFVNVDKKGKILVTHKLSNPFSRMTGDVDERFVDANGALRVVKISDRSNTTLEDVFPPIFGNTRPILHLFLFSDIVTKANANTITTNREWNGRIYPYFPQLRQTYDTDLEDEKEKRYLQARVRFVESSLMMMENLDGLIRSQTVPLKQFRMTSLKFLRLVWKRPFREVPDVETLFYQIPATYVCPFLRILPFQGVPISKLYIESPLRIPSFDPRLIEQWVEQKPPSKDDFLYGKVMIRDKQGPEPALFGTLRVFDDRSADFIVQPPKNLNRLLFQDIQLFPQYLGTSLENSYLQNSEVEIGEANLVCSIRNVGLKTVSKQQFLQRLKSFAPLFLQIPSLPNENPLVMLRYRAVSKFTMEDKVFTFLTQLSSRKVETDADVVVDTVNEIMDTFQLPFQQASTLYKKWLDEKGKITLNIAETKDFILQYNRGVDIAVFADQSSYYFHLYRIESTIHLRRILTALSLLLSAEDEDLQEEDAGVFEDAASVVDEEAKDDTQGDETFVADLNAAELADIEDLAENADDVLEEETVAVPVFAKPVLATTVVPKPKMIAEPLDKVRIREFFTKRLYETDPNLFPTSETVRKKVKEEGKAKTSEQSYSIKCQSTDDRQPIVMNSDKYEAMKDEYQEDDVTFIEFPLQADAPPASGLVVPVLLYGSRMDSMNYYICCEYFCLRDYIMVLENDFKRTSYRPKRFAADGTEVLKPANTCPFCGGKLIENKKNPGVDETVYKRKDNNKNKYIGLLQNTVHPEGIFQPCCFGKLPKYRMTDPKFAHLHYRARTEEEEEEEEKGTTVTATIQEEMSYSLALLRAHKKYIVEKNKFPLGISSQGGPQIGLLLALLDPFFQQEDSKFIHTSQQKQELLPDSKGFLRIGVDNSQLGKSDSLFAAVAPYLKLNSANDVRRRILEVLHPRNFLFLNYGNLVLEFYNPSDAGPTDTALRLWATTNLEVEIKDTNKDAVLRLWKSYHRFRDFVESRSAFKEYRQFAQMLAMPGFLTVRGLILIVLDIVKVGEADKLEIRCPPYGYDNEQYGDADIGFITHHHSGAWEPIFYSENERAKGRFTERHEATLNFQRALSETWPDIIKRRVYEFSQKCSGPARAAWTSGSFIDPYALIPVSRAIAGMAQSPEGVIRDVYNHIVALTFRAEAGKSKLVAVPVVDDGTIVTPARLYFDWNDYIPATIDGVVRFYEEYVESIFSYYPGYSVRRAVRENTTNKIVALQLTNGLYIPCEAIKAEDPSIARTIESLGIREIANLDDMEWAINRDILFGTSGKKDTLPTFKSTENLVNEGFEYLRLIFSNWFSSEQVSGTLRQQVESVLMAKHLPLFEKRKRLFILLGSEILKWMDTEEEFKDEQKSLLRADCRLATGPDCPGQCVWKASEGKCRLHVPGTTEVFANVPEMLMRRLMDELLRFPERRKQLLEKKVSPLVSLKQAIVIKDQYILPESSLAWYDLLHKEWTQGKDEEKKFYEEMSAERGEVALPVPKEDTVEQGALSEGLRNLLGEESESKDYFLYKPDVKEGDISIQPFLVSLGVFPEDIGLESDAFELTEDAMRKLVLKIRRPVFQLELYGEGYNSKAFTPAKRMKDPTPFILVVQDIDKGGPAMLSLSPTKPIPIPLEKLSSGLQFINEESTPVMDSGKK